MFRKAYIFVLLGVFAISLSGCVTARASKQKDLESQGLRNQVSALESQIQRRDQEINSLKEELNSLIEQKNQAAAESVKEKPAVGVSTRPTTKQVQTALKNAGFYTGNVDGHMGKKTHDAVKAFQKVNNLTVSGKVSKKTWALLSGYLTQKTK